MARIVHSQDPQKYNITLAAALKDIKELKAPEWVSFVKSGVSKERVP
nr:40S ribosomal protein S19 [archaeon]